MKKQTKKKVNNGDKKCYALEDCYWRISDTNICTSPDECLSNLKPKKMKTTKAELLQKIIEKQYYYIKYLLAERCPEYKTALQLRFESNIAALNTQLAEQQSTPVKQAFDKSGFFESQMEEEPDRETLRKELIKYEEFCGTYFDDSDQLIDSYLTQKNKT